MKFLTSFGIFTATLPGFILRMRKSGKKSAGGADLFVWQDYVAGTDPTDPNSKFTASITFVNGHPIVSWSPKAQTAGAMPRVYNVYGKEKLSDTAWTLCDENTYDNFNFFKVTVRLAGEAATYPFQSL